ncbi:MAG: hypothetical protein NT099_00870 [Candidatus Saganbacteria bacterium]|nr:hypothetical protein [Candidatus Saganbacteria bacterium]
MVTFFGLLFSLFLPVIIGLMAVSLVLGKKADLPFAEKNALSFLIGVALLTLSLLLFGLAGIPFVFIYVVIFWALILSVVLFFMIKNKASFSIPLYLPFSGSSWLERFLALVIGFKIIYIYFQALISPIYTWDALMNWSYRAKVFFFARGLALDGNVAPFFGGVLQNYPINIPLMQTWVAICLQGWDEFLIKIIFPTFFLCLVIIFYYELRRFTERRYALFFTFLLTAMPLLVYHASSGYMDFIVGAYFFAAAAMLWNWIKSGEKPFLILSSLLGVGAAWTKDEGLVLWGILFFVFLVYSLFQKGEITAKIKKAAVYAAAPAMFIIIWFGLKSYYKLAVIYVVNFGDQKGILGFHPEALSRALENTFFTGGHGLVFVLFVLAGIMCFREIVFSDKKYIFFMAMLAWLFWLFLYGFTLSYETVFTGIIQHRNYLTFTPLLLYVCAVLLWDKYHHA